MARGDRQGVIKFHWICCFDDDDRRTAAFKRIRMEFTDTNWLYVLSDVWYFREFMIGGLEIDIKKNY